MWHSPSWTSSAAGAKGIFYLEKAAPVVALNWSVLPHSKKWWKVALALKMDSESPFKKGKVSEWQQLVCSNCCV